MSSNTAFDESKALRQLANGDSCAFKQVYDRYAPSVYRFALQYLGSVSLAEDVVQEVFTSLWQHQGKLPHVRNFANYLFKMTKHQAQRVSRSAKVREQRNKMWAESQSHDTRFDIELDKAYEYRFLLEAIDNLPPQRRLVFQLGIEGLSHAEIGKKMDLSPLTVKTHMKLAIRSLRQEKEKLA